MIAAILLSPALAQRQYEEVEQLMHDLETHRRPPVNTEFIFARVSYRTVAAARGYRRILEGWGHDYPVAEEHILQVASEATRINLTNMSYVIVPLESDEIFQYPFLYFSEVGEMYLTEREITNLREYMNRGGFAMIDDFDSQSSLDWFLSQMKQVFPERDFPELQLGDAIFHTFYEIPTLEIEPPYAARDGGNPRFYGYYDNRGHLLMIINHNNDMGDFWEWIDQPRYPLQPSTEGLRFGINYLLFSLTH
jgi:uncharacterized protein DUF4159